VVAKSSSIVVGGGLAALLLAAGAYLLFNSSEQPKPAQLHVAPPPYVRNVSFEVATGQRIALRDRPGGRIVGYVRDTTEFGSPETLSPTGRRSRWWAAVMHTSLGNEKVAWIDGGRGLVYRRRPVSLAVDLSRRELVVLRGKGVLRRMRVAVGAPDTPSPPGEYYVTDKLPGSPFGRYYGCCILALSGHQPNLPHGWSGGDRLAIHGSPTPTWGENVSNGCFHASAANLRYLMKTVPLGTQVLVHA
jgi:L,D-transpeptidase catalytic domain